MGTALNLYMRKDVCVTSRTLPRNKQLQLNWSLSFLPLVLEMASMVLYLDTSVNLVHNAQVCYFNNVWLMFLIF